MLPDLWITRWLIIPIQVTKEYQTVPEVASNAVGQILDKLQRFKSVGTCTAEEERALKSVYVRMLELTHGAAIIVEGHRLR